MNFTVFPATVDAHGAPSYRYLIDYGKNLQGHVNISFGSSRAGQTVVVRLGEQLQSNGSVKYQMESNNLYSDTWTLSGTTDTFVYGRGDIILGSFIPPHFWPHPTLHTLWCLLCWRSRLMLIGACNPMV